MAAKQLTGRDQRRSAAAEAVLETCARAAVAGVLVLASTRLSPVEIGAASLAGSVVTLAAGFVMAGWSYRLQADARHPVSSRSAGGQMLTAYLVAVPLCILLTMLLAGWDDSVVWACLAVLAPVPLLLASADIVWGWAGRAGLSPQLAMTRLVAGASGLVVGVGVFIAWPSALSQVLVQTALWGAVVVGSLFFLLARAKASPALRIPRVRDFAPRPLSGASWTIVAGNTVATLTFVLDNFILARLSGLADLAAYSIAFGAMSFAVGVVGSTGQRMRAVARPDERSAYVYSWLPPLAALGLAVCAALALWGAGSWFGVPLLDRAARVSLLLLPYAAGRTRLLITYVVIGRLHRPADILRISILQSIVLAVLAAPLALALGPEGVAVAASAAVWVAALLADHRVRSSARTKT